MSLNIELIEQSFELIKPRAEEFVVSFYDTLFIAYPEVQPLFAKTDMTKQYKKLLSSLVLVVESIRHPEALGQVLEALGARHVGYGAIREYYPAVGHALLNTFEQYLQDNWTAEVKQAWTDAYTAITVQMLHGAGEDVTPEELQINQGEIPGRKEPSGAHPTATDVPEILAAEEVEPLAVEILESSFELIKPRADEFAGSFYENLFAIHPEMRPLFADTDMPKQQKKLLNSLVLVVEGLRNPEALAQVLQALGSRHVGYGTIPKHYGPVGQALLMTLEQYLGENWTLEVKKAWTNAYRAITAEMLKGAGVDRIPEPVWRKPQARTKPAEEASGGSKAAAVELAAEEAEPLAVEILENSFALIKPRADEFAGSFYENLFAIHPEMRPLFAGTDMPKQQKKLLNSLVLVVEGLRNPEALAQVLQALGSRHVGYGTIPKHYGPVGQALLMTLEQYLGENWTLEVKKAWTNAYRAITAEMLKGARAVSDAPKPAQEPKKTPTPDKPTSSKAQSPPKAQQGIPNQRQSRQVSKSGIGQSLPFFGAMVAKYGRSFPIIASFERLLLNFIAFWQKILAFFWSIPIWGVALIATVIMIVIFLNLDSDSLLARVMERSNHISMVVALVLFIREAPLRRKQYHYQAWRTIDGATGVKVSHARIMALQDLNGDGVALKGLDAPGADLAEIHLSKVNLSEANLTQADLSQANLIDANLHNGNLSSAKLIQTNLCGANLSFANLSKANLSSANLAGANLICTDFNGANMNGANLSGARLGGANLDGAYLMGANLKGAQVTSSELRGAMLEGAIMPDGYKYKSQKS